MIDPDREDVIRFGADGSRVELRNEDRIDQDSVILGFQLTPDDLFAELYVDWSCCVSREPARSGTLGA
jgi:hypothetical protein